MQYHLAQLNCGRSGWRRVAFHVVISVGLFALVSACTPYPVYTHSDPEPDRRDRPRESADDTYSRVTDREAEAEFVDATEPLPPSTVDPRVFARVVETYLGIPYRRGGQDIDGMDCSNLASALYQDYAGKRIPSTTRSLYRLPGKVPQGDLQVGDLVFFTFGGRTPTHVGVYMDDGRFVHASESRGVIFSSLETPYYRDAYRGARRVR